jgi:hypothetical protein
LKRFPITSRKMYDTHETWIGLIVSRTYGCHETNQIYCIFLQLQESTHCEPFQIMTAFICRTVYWF